MPAADRADPTPALRARRLAWEVLQAVERGAYADGALEQVFNRASAGPSALTTAERALTTELAYGAIRQQGLLNAWLDQLGKVPAGRQPPKLRSVLQLGAYQLLFCGGIPASAAVHTSVELARQVGLARLASVVNAVLRELGRLQAGDVRESLQPWTGLRLPVEPAASLALRRSLPLWLAQALLQWLPPDQAEHVAGAFNATPRLDLRVNLSRTTVEALQAALSAAGVGVAPIPGVFCGLELTGRRGDLRQLPGYGDGLWSVQDRSAQAVVPLLAPERGEWILDACAAPGGKTTQIAELTAGDAVVWAVDRAEARLRRLQRNAERLGLGGIHVLTADATALPELRPEWLGRFDAVLLDAPCSGLGTLARHSDARWRITPDSIDALVLLQQQLLVAMAPLLRPGGRLVYATCTLCSWGPAKPANRRQEAQPNRSGRWGRRGGRWGRGGIPGRDHSGWGHRLRGLGLGRRRGAGRGGGGRLLPLRRILGRGSSGQGFDRRSPGLVLQPIGLGRWARGAGLGPGRHIGLEGAGEIGLRREGLGRQILHHKAHVIRPGCSRLSAAAVGA